MGFKEANDLGIKGNIAFLIDIEVMKYHALKGQGGRHHFFNFDMKVVMLKYQA